MSKCPNCNNKIKTLKELGKIAVRLVAKNKSTILCHGDFDLLHIGHIRHLKKAKEMGDILMVTIIGDKYVDKGLNRPVFSENYRAEIIAALECVDYVAIVDAKDAVKSIEIIKPNIYAKGQDSNILAEKSI